MGKFRRAELTVTHSPPLPLSPRLPSVCSFKTSSCVPAPRPHVVPHARGAGTLGDILNLHTEAFFQCATPHNTHNTHTTTHTTTPQNNNTEQHTETDRDRENKRRQDERRGETRQEKRREKMKENRRETRLWLSGFSFFCSKLPDPRIISNFQNNRLPIPNTIFPGNFCLCELPTFILQELFW